MSNITIEPRSPVFMEHLFALTFVCADAVFLVLIVSNNSPLRSSARVGGVDPEMTAMFHSGTCSYYITMH